MGIPGRLMDSDGVPDDIFIARAAQVGRVEKRVARRTQFGQERVSPTTECPLRGGAKREVGGGRLPSDVRVARAVNPDAVAVVGRSPPR
jgi:hypothetical protein